MKLLWSRNFRFERVTEKRELCTDAFDRVYFAVAVVLRSTLCVFQLLAGKRERGVVHPAVEPNDLSNMLLQRSSEARAKFGQRITAHWEFCSRATQSRDTPDQKSCVPCDGRARLCEEGCRALNRPRFLR